MRYEHLFKYLTIILLFSSSLLFGESSYSYLITPGFRGKQDLTYKAGLFIEKGSDLTIEDIRNNDILKNIHFDKIIKPNLGISRQTYWIKINLPSGLTEKEDFFLQIRCPYINEFDGYLFNSDLGKIEEVFHMGRTQLSDSPAPLYRYPMVPVTSKPGITKTVYLRMRSTDNIFIDLALYSSDMFVREIRNSMTVLIIVYGIIVSMILFNCILLIGTPSGQMIKYILYMVFLLLYLFSADGMFFMLFTYRFPYLAIRSNYFLSIAVMVSLLVFTRTYLEIDQRYFRSDIMLNGFITASLLLFFFFVVSKTFELLLVVAGIIEVISFVFLFLVSLRASLKQQRAAYYYLSSWGVLIILAFLTQLRTLGFLPPGFLTTGSLNIGAAFQVILLSVGIADRMNSLQQDNLRLKTEKERIEEEFQQKTGFFVNIAHELRTPLTLLIGVNEEFLTGKHDETLSRTNPGFLIIRRNLKRIEGLVNRISTIIRIDHRLLVPEKQRINLNTLMQEISTNYYPKGIRENLCFEYFDRTGASLYAEQDRNLIKSALENVIANAFQYTSEGSITFILDITADHETAIIRILDTGIGIPTGSVNEIFKRFVRLPEAQTLRKEGLGIGLSMVQQIVSLHNGSISINSEHGKGSEFIIRLPLSSIGPRAAKEITLKPIKPPGIKDGSMSTNSSNNKSTVLLVEDDTDLLEFLSLRLGTVFSVYTARSGSDALNILDKGFRPDIIVSDIMMPGMDGRDLFYATRKKPALSSLPFLFITARDLDEEKLTLIEDGAVDYITKPFDPGLLKARIAAILRLSVRQPEDYTDSIRSMCDKYSLSPRQIEIVLLLLQGKNKKEISAELKSLRGKKRGKSISVKTADNHIQKIYEVLKVHSQYELISLFIPLRNNSE